MSETSKAADAQKAEATEEKFTVEIDGEQYTPVIQGDGTELYKAIETLEQGRVLAALRMMLGNAEYRRYMAHNPSVRTAAKAVRDIQAKLDVDLGELLD